MKLKEIVNGILLTTTLLLTTSSLFYVLRQEQERTKENYRPKKEHWSDTDKEILGTTVFGLSLSGFSYLVYKRKEENSG